jgi:hypothetical protein
MVGYVTEMFMEIRISFAFGFFGRVHWHAWSAEPSASPIRSCDERFPSHDDVLKRLAPFHIWGFIPLVPVANECKANKCRPNGAGSFPAVFTSAERAWDDQQGSI